jgi:hypothetical protein
VNRSWIVRSVALLLVLVGVQAGSFRDLYAGHERYYGTEDYSAAVRPEARKPDVVPVDPPFAQPPRRVAAPPFTAFASPARRATGGRASPRRLLPDSTGPPRA